MSFENALLNEDLGQLGPIAENIDATSLDGSLFDDTSTHASAEYSMLDGYFPPSVGQTITEDNSIIEEGPPVIDSTPKNFKENSNYVSPKSDLYSVPESESDSPVCSVDLDYASDGDGYAGLGNVEEGFSIVTMSSGSDSVVDTIGESLVNDYTVSSSSSHESLSIGSLSIGSGSITAQNSIVQTINERPDSASKKLKNHIAKQISKSFSRNKSKSFSRGRSRSPLKDTELKTSETRSTSLPVLPKKVPAPRATSLPRLPNKPSVSKDAALPSLTKKSSVSKDASLPRLPKKSPISKDASLPRLPKKASVSKEATLPNDDFFTMEASVPIPMEAVPIPVKKSVSTRAEASKYKKSSVLRKNSAISADGVNKKKKASAVGTDGGKKRKNNAKKKKDEEKKRVKNINGKNIVMSKGIKQPPKEKVIKKKKKDKLTTFQNGSEAWQMKKTSLRLKKSRVKKKSNAPGFQLNHIRIGSTGTIGGQSIDKPTGEKVMRVCKITSKGYILAEFPTTDPNNTPLHIACLTHYSERFIMEHLLKEDSNDVETENSDCELPLHYAVKDKQGVHHDVLETLIKLYPGSVRHPNIDGSLPVHVACQAGVPSIYAFKRLVELYPDSLLYESDICIPIDDEEPETDAGCIRLAISELFFMEWNKEGESKPKFESGWSPLHLAAIHGAPPFVIEHILEANRDCRALTTSENRTAIECAKWIVVNSLLSDISVKAFQNTFAAIEIMQSYEEEAKIRDHLLIKSGLATSVLESTEVIGSWWMGAADYIPDPDAGGDFGLGNSISEDDEAELHEIGLTPLHRSVMNKDPPDEVKVILEENPDCIDIKSADDRTPLEWSKTAIITALLEGKPVASMKNWFLALQIMQEYVDNGNGVNDKVDVEDLLPRSTVEAVKTAKEGTWSQAFNKYAFMKNFIANNGNSALGKVLVRDNDSAVQPHEFFPPENLTHVNIKINLPVGFRRVRKAILYQNSMFVADVVLKKKLKCTGLTVDTWNKCSQDIGWPRKLTLTGNDIKISEFIGAKRKFEYKLPNSRTDNCALNVSETMELLVYNDFCFVVKSIRQSPDIPDGKLFETHSQFMFIDKGMNSCRMVGSMDVNFLGIRPALAWQIKNRMRLRTADFFGALASCICEHSTVS